TGERKPPEPGSREGSCPGDGVQSGDRLWYPETRRPVNEPTAPRPRFSVAITGRTVCGKAARTGLWGRRGETSGATRQDEDDELITETPTSRRSPRVGRTGRTGCR